MPGINDWASGNPYGFDRRAGAPRKPQRSLGEKTEVQGLYFRNVDSDVKVLFANEETGEVIEADDNMITFVVISATAAEQIRDELLVPGIFPESV